MSAAAELYLEIEREFQELKKEYTLFLSDMVKIEPYEQRERMLTKVKRLRNMSNLRTEDQFRSNNLIAKVQTHIQLWERQLERKYSGKGQKPRPKRKVQEAPKNLENKSVMISDAGKQRDKIVELYDEYMRLNLLLGARKMINFSKFQNFISNQTKKIQTTKQTDKVRYEVAVQDQKVIIKSKSIK